MTSEGGPDADRGPTETEGSVAILVVEDDEGLRPILARHLRHQGFVVSEAASAEEASAALLGGLRPALIVLDVNLPGDTGWDLLRSSAMEVAGSPPVIIASAVSVSPRHLAEFGIAGYLPKPFPLETLLQTVERLLAAPDPEGATDADD
jgi:two-component system phosphate regulon response regulator OmpR